MCTYASQLILVYYAVIDGASVSAYKIVAVIVYFQVQDASVFYSSECDAVVHAPVSAKPAYSNTHKSMATVAPTTR